MRERPASRHRSADIASSLDLYGCSSLFQLRLDFIYLVFAHAFLDGIRRFVHQGLGLLQAKSGDGSNSLDHV